MSRSCVVTLTTICALAVPASASAHARSATVALDYRLVLDRSATSLPGISVAILDGDRALQVRVRRGELVVLGDLGEPMLRLTPGAAYASRASVTAIAQKLVASGHGWKRVGSGSDFAWHEHRLAPPPFDDGQPGAVARFTIPAQLDGRTVEIGGTFVRYRRPALWPWLAGALAAGVLLAGGLRRCPALRRPAATALGSLAGLAALGTLVVFGSADAPNGRVAWAQIVGAVALATVLTGVLLRARGIRRAQLAGLVGAAAFAISLGSLSVFWHGVVISVVPATPSRLLCALAFLGGIAAAASSVGLSERA